MKKFLNMLLIAMLVVSMTATASLAANYRPSPGGEDLDIFDENPPLANLPDVDIGDTDTPLGELPTVVTPPIVVNENGQAHAEVDHQEIAAIVELIKESQSSEDSKVETIVIVPVSAPEEQHEKVSVALSSETSSQIVNETNASVVVLTDAGAVVVPNETLNTLSKESEKELVITITQHAPEVGQDMLSSFVVLREDNKEQVTEVNVHVDGEKVTSFEGNTLTLLLPVSSDDYEVGAEYEIMQISDNGVVNRLKGKCVLYAGKLYMQVTVTHLSTFVVAKSGGDPVVEIPDPSTPLVESPKTGVEFSVMPVVVALFVGVSILGFAALLKKKA